MKYSSRLISNVRSLFGFLRGLTAVTLVLLPLLAFLPGASLSLPDLPFKANAMVTPKVDSAARQKVQIVELRGKLHINPITAEDRNLYRYVLLVPGMMVALFTFGIFHLIWRLCRNVEDGEVFSLTNVKLVRRIGVLLITYSVASFVAGLWLGNRMLVYARERFSFSGIELHPDSTWAMLKLSSSLLEVETNYLVIGLLVLCLAEVFRQGLKLQQEAELTV